MIFKDFFAVHGPGLAGLQEIIAATAVPEPASQRQSRKPALLHWLHAG
jgi:hypothetical protein